MSDEYQKEARRLVIAEYDRARDRDWISESGWRELVEEATQGEFRVDAYSRLKRKAWCWFDVKFPALARKILIARWGWRRNSDRA